ncbi:hypothetical protein LTS18_014994, partial [Coniosporium uncinatum]
MLERITKKKKPKLKVDVKGIRLKFPGNRASEALPSTTPPQKKARLGDTWKCQVE